MTQPAFDHARSFGSQADAYARHRPEWPAPVFDWIASHSPALDRAIDVATGSGQGAVGLARHFRHVLAIDRSPDLVGRIPRHPAIEPGVQDAEMLSAEPADALTVFQALHWFAGDRFNARVAACTRPGALVFVAGYSWFTVDPGVDAVIGDRWLPRFDPYWSPRNRILLEGYRGVSFPWEEMAVPGFAIEVTWTRAELVAYLGTWSAVAAMREAEGRDPLLALDTEIRGVWPGEDARRVRMPVHARAFRVTAQK